MALHQIHKIMLFLATSYDPFNLLLWYCICVLSADMMGTHCSAALNITTLWLTAGRWWLQWQHNAVTQEFVCSEKNEKRFDSDIEALFISGRWNLRSLLSGASNPIASLFMTLLWQFKFCCHLRSQSLFSLNEGYNTNFMIVNMCVSPPCFCLLYTDSVIFGSLRFTQLGPLKCNIIIYWCQNVSENR